jgi:hypothetical protein
MDSVSNLHFKALISLLELIVMLVGLQIKMIEGMSLALASILAQILCLGPLKSSPCS